MFSKKKSQDRDLKNPSNLGAVIHKTVMFLTYPFRRPMRWFTIAILIFGTAYAVPLYYGAKPLEVHTWYWQKINKIAQGDFSDISKEVTRLVHKLPFFEKEQNKGTDYLVEYTPESKNISRQSFKTATTNAEPQKVDILAQEAENVVSVVTHADNTESFSTEEIIEKPKEIVIKKSETETVIVKRISEDDKEMLTYLVEPQEIRGTANIINANEMEVNGTYLFLYGIYSNPLTSRGVKASVFLKEALKDTDVTCKILAYTQDDVATAECFVAGVSINNELVKRGFSDKVTLK